MISEVQGEGKNVLLSAGGGWNPFTMRVDTGTFSDVRIRQAMRLVVDRQQMLDLVFGGFGTLGNDLFGIWAPEYDHSLPQRHQDIDQAKSLLKAAGAEGLHVTLVTSDIAQGTVLAAQVFAQQASEAGIIGERGRRDRQRVLRHELPEVAVRPGLLVLQLLPAAGVAGHAADRAVQRDALGQLPVQLAVRPGHRHRRRRRCAPSSRTRCSRSSTTRAVTSSRSSRR